jgi:hypothetical protein
MPGSNDFRTDVLRKPGSIEAVAVLIQTMQELTCVPLAKGADSNDPICLASGKCFSVFNERHLTQWLQAETDQATLDTLRWTRVAQRAEDQYCLELLTLRKQGDRWQPTYSGMISIDTFPIGSNPCRIEAFVIQENVHVIAWACSSLMRGRGYAFRQATVEEDVGWIGFSTIPQAALISDPNAGAIQTLILRGRRRCSHPGTGRRLDNFLYTSQDHCHILTMTLENAIEVHSRRTANCAFDSKPSHTIAASGPAFVRPVGISENFAVYTETRGQHIDVGIFNYRDQDGKAQSRTFKDALRAADYGHIPWSPKVWVSDTVLVAIQGMRPSAMFSTTSDQQGTHHWIRSDSANEMTVALGWSGTAATKIQIADDWIRTDQLTFLIISGTRLVAISLCRRGKPPSVLDVRPANISCHRLLEPDGLEAPDDGAFGGGVDNVRCSLRLSPWHRPHHDEMLLLEGQTSVLIRASDAFCRFLPRISADHGVQQWDQSRRMLLQYPSEADPEESENLRLPDGWTRRSSWDSR